MKKAYLAIAIASLLLLTGCGKQAELISITSGDQQGYTQSYIISGSQNFSQQLYGTVVVEDMKNIMNSVGGTLTSIDCQPGKLVFSDTVIATVTPNENDPSIKNLYLQQASLEQQLSNLQDSYDMTEQNFDIQKETLYAQTENTQNVYGQDSADLQKIENSIQNFKDQQENTILDTLKKVRSNGGSTKNSSLYYDTYDQRNDIQDMSDDEFSQYLEDMADLSKKASTYASGDTLSSMFMWLSNGFRASKSAFDSLADTFISAQTAYENQHNNLWLTIDLADQQAQAIENNKQIQLNVLDSQMQSIQQTLDSLSNNVSEEQIYAGVDGIIKTKGAGEWNKVSPNTLLCQITPSDSNSLKIQAFSSNQIKKGQKVGIFSAGKFIMTGVILNELPYKDIVTQNYIYEIPHVTNLLKDQERVTIQLGKNVANNEVRIPLEYVQPKLEGNIVRRKQGTGVQDLQVVLWTINTNMIQVLSGLNMGDEIVR